jgi:AcrR family transcriptional regulator
MSITIEHDKRKKEILEKALDVFVDEGYEDTTFQKIAERCGITRTILYIYFKNKREIFTFSIKLFSEKLENELRLVAADAARSQSDKLAAVVSQVIDVCAKNARLLGVVLDYLGHLKASGGNPDERVRRRTIRMRHILSGMIIEGQRSGEFAAFPVKVAGDLLYAMIESAIFRIAVLGKADAGNLVQAVGLFASRLGPVVDRSAERAPDRAASTSTDRSGEPAPARRRATTARKSARARGPEDSYDPARGANRESGERAHS